MIAKGSIPRQSLSVVALLGLVGCGTVNQATDSNVNQATDSNPTSSAPPQVLRQVIAPIGRDIQIDGSSTVLPLSEAIAKAYGIAKGPEAAKIDLKSSGTTGGFRKFCAGEIDISGASRPILKAEMAACDQQGVRYIELPVAFDALTLVVHPQNSWAQDITVEELKKVWEPAAEGKISNWNQIRPSYPDRPLKLYGAGKDSGTFDYFNEVTSGDAKASRSDYTASEDDNALVTGVSQDPNALGYFGFAYFELNQQQLKALPVDYGKGEGAVMPSREAVEKAQYRPFARPLFIYVNSVAAQQKPELQAFVLYYIRNSQRLAAAVKYIPLTDEGYRLGELHFYRGKVGTVFGGTPQPDLTIGELLRKQATF